MNREILVSGTLALAVHALLFTFPLSMTMSSPPTSVSKPISLSIVHSQEAVAAMPQAEVSAEVLVQDKTRYDLSEEEAVILQKQVTPKKPLPEERTTLSRSPPEGAMRSVPSSAREVEEESVKEMSLGSVYQGQDGKGESKTPTETVSLALDGKGHPEIPQGGQSGSYVIVDARPMYKKNPLPHYPRSARRRGSEGKTILRVEVLESGEVGQIELAASSGFEVLDGAALKSVKEWCFVPGTRNGKKTRQWVLVPVRFSLK